MPQKLELLGRVFSRLTVLSLATAPDRSRGQYWNARCECGTVKAYQGSSLVSGHTRSCGCLMRETSGKKCLEYNAQCVTHGHTVGGGGDRTYKAWTSMRGRCFAERGLSNKNYASRGITICPEWRDYPKFLADMGPCPAGMSLERVNNDAGYSKDNCMWADRKTQSRNRRNNVLLSLGEETAPLSVWAEKFSIDYHRLYHKVVTRKTSLVTALRELGVEV